MASFAQTSDSAGSPISKVNSTTVKTMFDHGLHPQKHKLVIPDNDPRIGAVM
jgi:hypothetical protein